MRVLFTTPVLLHPPAGGPALRIENSIKALNQVSELHVVSRLSKEEIGGEQAEIFYKKICHKFFYSPGKRSSVFGKLSKFRFNTRDRYINFVFNLPFRSWSKVYWLATERESIEEQDVRFLIRYHDANKIEAIWFGYGNISYDLMRRIKTERPEIKIVCDTDSVWSRFVLREVPYENDLMRKKEIEERGKRKELEEASWVNFCDVTTAVSDVDAQYYRNLAMNKEKIMLFSNVIDLKNYKARPQRPSNFKKPCMYIAGSYGPKSPMDKATRWVIDKVLPIVKKEIAEIHFYIVGAGSDHTLSEINDSSITITGKLDSVLPYLCNADVSLVPLKFESGTRFKILEAGACNIPVVSTTLGAEGIPLTDQKDVLIADVPEEFANSIIKLIKDKEYAGFVASNCRTLVEQRYSINRLVEEAKDILDYLKKLRQ